MIKSLIEKLKKVNDFRKPKGKRHELWLILLLIIIGIMYGYKSYRGLGDFLQNNQESLCKLLKIYPSKLPSYSTIRRTLEGVNWENMLTTFNEWAQTLASEEVEPEWLCLDGKSARNTLINYQENRQNFLVFASMFSQDSGLVLQLKRFENKQSSEIAQVQDLIRTSGIKNTIFTLDALHCQTQTLSTILASENNYLITVKKNQSNLYKSLTKISQIQSPENIFLEKDCSHGRIITRQISVFNVLHKLPDKWSSIKTFIQVIRKGTRGKKSYEQIAYYISNISENAEILGKKIRGHWQIENKLHWVKDVIFGEDKSLISAFQPATNMSILQTIALNFFRILGFLSITEGQRWLTGKASRLQVLLL